MVFTAMVAPSRLRPLTFFGRVPKGATNVDICKALVQRFSQSELKSVQDFGAGRFEVTFRTKAAVDRFSADPALKVRDVVVSFEYRGVRAKMVRVFGYPSDLPDQALSSELAVFGKVLGISEECVPGFSSVGTGNRRIRMEMLRPVPNLLRVGDRVIQCEYEGVARLCRRCNLEVTSRSRVRRRSAYVASSSVTNPAKLCAYDVAEITRSRSARSAPTRQ